MVAYFHIDLGVSTAARANNHTMLVENNYVLVDLFFVLSGFIMAYVYWEKFSRSLTYLDYRRYFIARISRVYPLHIVTLLFMLLVGLYSKDDFKMLDNLNDFIQNILLIHAWGMSDRFMFNFPSWSVSVEFFA